MSCPDIDELLALEAADPTPAIRSHLARCEACGEVMALIASRGPRSASRATASAACAELEPAIAAMVDGTIHRLELARLIEHLGECGPCSDLASQMTLVRPELDDIPEPSAPGMAAGVAPVTGPGAEITVVRRPPAANGAPRRGLGTIGKRVLFGLVPPPTHRAVWAAQLALVGLVTWGVTHAVGDRGAAIGPAHDGVEAAPAGGPDVAAALERARRAEDRAKEAEERARKAEERLIEREKRIAELEEQLHPEKRPVVAPSSSAAPADALDPFATRHETRAIEGEPGFLTVVCNPFCDDVIDNGRSLGPSPIVHLAVSPGTHKIKLKRGGSGTKVISVIVVSGQITAQRVSMKDGGSAEPVPAGAREFNRGAASSAMSSAAGSAQQCGRANGPTGQGTATVTFATSGEVSSVVMSSPFAGNPVGNCVAGLFRGVRVPPFDGDPMTVSRSFTVPALKVQPE